MYGNPSLNFAFSRQGMRGSCKKMGNPSQALESYGYFCYNSCLEKTHAAICGLEDHMRYQTNGTCSTAIDIEVKDGIIEAVSFTGGCNGNLKGICSLVRGMKVEDAISRLKGIQCGFKSTSCPDQLARALESMQ